MDIEVLADAEAVARRAAAVIAGEARSAVAARGAFSLAVSGGSTPWRMLALLAEEEVPWAGLHLLQVDERVAPEGDPERNLTQLRAALPGRRIHAMPVEDGDLHAAAARYAATLRAVAGDPPVLDLVHLGLGADGHTASLVPGDAVLDERGADVAPTARPYQGRRRLTLTYPVLERARRILWVVTGASKATALRRLRDGDRAIPAGRVPADRALLLADREAAALL